MMIWQHLAEGQQAVRTTYLLFFLALLTLIGTGISAAVLIVQPETGLTWQSRSGLVTDVTAGSPAAQAGLQIGDRLLAVDGRPLAALPDATNGRRAGEKLPLTIQTARETQTVWLTLSSAAAATLAVRLLPLLVGLGFGVIGLAAYQLSEHRFPAALFAVTCLTVVGVLGTGVLSTFKIPLAIRLFNVGLALVAALTLHFHLHLLQVGRGVARRNVLLLAYNLAGLWVLFFLLPGWSAWRWQPWYPALQWALRLALGVSLAGQIVLLHASRRSPQRSARRHARLMLAGALLSLAPFLLFALLPDLLYGRPWLPFQYTFPFLLILPLTYGYTLARGRLSRWDHAAGRVVTTLVVIILLLSSYSLIILSLGRRAPIWLPVVLAAAAGLAFWPLARLAQRWSDRILFDIDYDYSGIVSTLGEQLAGTLDRPTLHHLLVERLPAMMSFSGAALLLTGEDGDLHLETPVTVAAELPSTLPGKGALARTLLNGEDVVTAVTLRQLLRPTPLMPEEAACLANLALESWLPLAREEELLGLLLLAPRPGGDLPDEQEWRILRSVAHQAALAVANVRLADALRASRAELAQAHGQLLLAREEERRQLAWFLHDGPVQQLLGLSYQLLEVKAIVAGNLQPPMNAAEQTLTDLWHEILAVVSQLRHLLRELRPPGLREMGLAAALKGHVDALLAESEGDFPAIKLNISLARTVLPEPAAVTLFRVAQEALRNAQQHAAATHIELSLYQTENEIILQVRDDGRGFTVPARLSQLTQKKHFGLITMAERARVMGGHLTIQSQPEQGTTISLRLPLDNMEIDNGQ